MDLFGFIRHYNTQKATRAVANTRKLWLNEVKVLFSRVKVDQLLWEQLEETLISADVGVETTLKLLGKLRDQCEQYAVVDAEKIVSLLREEVVDILSVGSNKQPLDSSRSTKAILVVGVNGVGKTTSIAKLANLYNQDGRKVLLGAADTFRAAGVEQLAEWARLLGIEIVAHKRGGDPGAVIFDTLQASDARAVDVAIIDTAGRLHAKTNLMDELKKIQRVIERSIGNDYRVLLVLDATTGQNGLAQARAFTEAVRCDGVFLSKLDGTSKGGIVIAIADQLGLPVVYIGTGEGVDDVVSFDPREFTNTIFGFQEKN